LTAFIKWRAPDPARRYLEPKIPFSNTTALAAAAALAAFMILKLDDKRETR